MTALRTGPGRKYREKGIYFQYASPTLRADIYFVRPAVIMSGAYDALRSSISPRSCRWTPASTFCGGNGVFTHQTVNESTR